MGAELALGNPYPALPRIRQVSATIAIEVVQIAWQRGYADTEALSDVAALVKSHMYDAKY